VAVAVVGYTCAPEGQYPVQLREGVESLVWLLSAGAKKPENVNYATSLQNYDSLTNTSRPGVHRRRFCRR
jgi:hypothetical protein